MPKHKKTKKSVQLHAFHKRRASWFAVVAAGLLIIQGAYSWQHSGRPQVLAYAADINRQQLLEATNSHRQGAKLAPLKVNSQLSVAAQAKADHMITNNYWGHVAPGGKEPWEFLKEAQYNYSVAGENLAYGFSDETEVVGAWMHSDSHRANVLGNYAEVGFGIAQGPHYQGGSNTVVVALYGTQQGGQAVPSIIGDGFQTTNRASQQVHGLTVVTSGSANWAAYASLGLLGASAVGFMVTHMDILRYGWHHRKKWLRVHPFIDGAILLAIAAALIWLADGFIG